MDLSRRDAFRPCSRDSSGDKGQFCFLAKKTVIGIGPPYRFYISLSTMLLIQNFFASSYRPSLSSTHFLLKTFKIYLYETVGNVFLEIGCEKTIVQIQKTGAVAESAASHLAIT